MKINMFKDDASYYDDTFGDCGNTEGYGNLIISSLKFMTTSQYCVTVYDSILITRVLHASMTRQNEELWLDLRVHNLTICSIHAYTDYEWADAGNTAIVHLYEGDNVTVAAHGDLENHLYGSSDHVFTTFSGAQIMSDSDLANPGIYIFCYFCCKIYLRLFNLGHIYILYIYRHTLRSGFLI